MTWVGLYANAAGLSQLLAAPVGARAGERRPERGW
jgi:hypothetical protein